MVDVEIVGLTRQLAEQHGPLLSELLNRIPLLDYTADDVLAEVSHRGKPLIGKWEHSLIAVSEGRIIAVLIAHMKQADPPYYPEASCYLSEVVVHEASQRQGIARRMTQQWLTSTAHLAPHSLQTNSRQANSEVIEFYRRMGFEEVSRKTYDNRTDMIMFRYSTK